MRRTHEALDTINGMPVSAGEEYACGTSQLGIESH